MRWRKKYGEMNSIDDTLFHLGLSEDFGNDIYVPFSVDCENRADDMSFRLGK